MTGYTTAPCPEFMDAVQHGFELKTWLFWDPTKIYVQNSPFADSIAELNFFDFWL